MHREASHALARLVQIIQDPARRWPRSQRGDVDVGWTIIELFMRAISAGPRDQIEAAWVGDVRIRTHDARRLGRRHRSRLEFDVEYAIRRLHASSFLRLSRARHARRVGGSTAGNTRLEMTHKMRRAAGKYPRGSARIIHEDPVRRKNDAGVCAAHRRSSSLARSCGALRPRLRPRSRGRSTRRRTPTERRQVSGPRGTARRRASSRR